MTEKGTNTDILGKKSKHKKKIDGRRQYNRDLILRHLKVTDPIGNPRYSLKQIAQMVGCSTKTVRRARDEALEKGTLVYEDGKDKAVGIIEADFDSECKRAKGRSFKEWLLIKNPTNETGANYIFNFCAKVWDKIWDKVSMVEFREKLTVADDCSIKYLKAFGEDKDRIRSRLKLIRNIYRFMGGEAYDSMNNYLSMNESQHPRSIRRIEQISFNTFPGLLQKSIEEFEQRYEKKYPGKGWLARLGIEFKLSTQMRTGKVEDEREFMGIRKGVADVGASYFSFEDIEQYSSMIWCKKSEQWRIIWLPRYVQEKFYRHLETLDNGELIFGDKLNLREYRKLWRKITKKNIGVGMSLHDLRKVGITWFFVLGIPLEVGSMINVGWKDLSTVMKHYADIKPILRLSKREAYAKEIPEWFKEGLHDFMGHDAMIPQTPTGWRGR